MLMKTASIVSKKNPIVKANAVTKGKPANFSTRATAKSSYSMITSFGVMRTQKLTAKLAGWTPVRLFSEDGEREFQPRMRDRNNFFDRREGREGRGERRERGEGGEVRRPRREPNQVSPILLIRGLPEARANAQEVANLASGFNVASVTPLKTPTGQYLGLCFVEMPSGEEALGAMRALRSASSPSEPMSIRPATAEEREKALADAANPQDIIAVRRIPFHCSEEDIKGLFPNTNIVSLSVGNGVAFVKCSSAGEAAKALEKNGAEYGRKTIIVEPAVGIEYDHHAARPIRMVRIRGAPATSTEQDIRNFFNGLDVNSVTITTREGLSGRTVPGDTFVEFADVAAFQAALKMDRQSLGDRYLQIYRSSPKERRFRVEGNNYGNKFQRKTPEKELDE